MTSASDSLRGFVLRVAVVAVALTLLCALYLAREALLLIYISALRVPYFYVLALIAAFGETVPILGPVMAGVSAVAVAASVSPKLAGPPACSSSSSTNSKPTFSCRKSWNVASGSVP